MYVSAPQATLRDSVAAVFTNLVTLQNGERVQVLSHDHQYVKVRSNEGTVGWVEQKYLVGQSVFDGFVRLAASHAIDPGQTEGTTRDDANMHVAPGRDAEKLYQLKKGDRIELLARASAPRELPKSGKLTVANANAGEASSDSDSSGSAAIPALPQTMEDWWLVRDERKRVGWIVGRLIDVDIPIAIKEGGFAEGQRVVASFVLTTTTDPSIVGPDQSVPIYLILFTDSKDGLPYDYNQVRVFVWDSHRAEHGYEMAYHERGLMGLLPVIVGKEYFGDEGVLPTFRLRVKDQNGGEEDRKYKLAGGIVKRIPLDGEVPPARPPVTLKPTAKTKQ